MDTLTKATSIEPIPAGADFWKTLADDYYANRNVWRETTHERYWEQCGMVPPARSCADGFAVGEAFTHTKQGRPVFATFVHKGSSFDKNSQFYAKYVPGDQYRAAVAEVLAQALFNHFANKFANLAPMPGDED